MKLNFVPLTLVLLSAASCMIESEKPANTAPQPAAPPPAPPPAPAPVAQTQPAPGTSPAAAPAPAPAPSPAAAPAKGPPEVHLPAKPAATSTAPAASSVPN